VAARRSITQNDSWTIFTSLRKLSDHQWEQFSIRIFISDSIDWWSRTRQKPLARDTFDSIRWWLVIFLLLLFDLSSLLLFFLAEGQIQIMKDNKCKQRENVAGSLTKASQQQSLNLYQNQTIYKYICIHISAFVEALVTGRQFGICFLKAFGAPFKALLNLTSTVIMLNNNICCNKNNNKCKSKRQLTMKALPKHYLLYIKYI